MDTASDKKHLFITGAGRSGTTFLWAILNRAQSIHLATEIHFFSSLFHNGFLKNLRRERGTKATLSVVQLTSFIASRQHFGIYWQKNNEFSSREIREYFKSQPITPKNIYSYLMWHSLLSSSKNPHEIAFIGEKTPLNIFHTRQLYQWFEDAKILFIHRNPIHVLKSEVNKQHKPDYPLAKGSFLYAYGLVFFVLIEWALAATIALYNRVRHTNQFLVISYEQLVEDPQRSVKRLCTALGIDYTGRLCEVRKIGSSYSKTPRRTYWSPPMWVESLYSLALSPLRQALDKVSLNSFR